MDAARAKNQNITAFLILVIGGFSYLGYQNYALSEANKGLAESLASIENQLASTTNSFHTLERDFISMSEAKYGLEQDLLREQEKVRSIAEQVSTITGTVTVLDKLRKTDPELLKKYSKVYFLNENYIPKPLVQVDPAFVYDNGLTGKWIHGSVEPFLSALMRDASGQGVELQIISAYRAFSTQADIKSSYSVVYGAGTANQFSADQGYSEHQLGTTIDFTTKKLASNFTLFGDTTAYEWLLQNAYRYGFILSYPKNNTYYRFEPWHWRFVGVKLAQKLHTEQSNFYDLTQREIDEYLVSLFDPM